VLVIDGKNNNDDGILAARRTCFKFASSGGRAQNVPGGHQKSFGKMQKGRVP
jgi:hypothetical protein